MRVLDVLNHSSCTLHFHNLTYNKLSLMPRPISSTGNVMDMILRMLRSAFEVLGFVRRNCKRRQRGQPLLSGREKVN